MKKLPKVAKAEDTVLQVGINVNTSLVKGIVPAGTDIKKVRVIGGYGTSSEFRSADELVSTIGGEKEKWQKKGGISETKYFIYDIHWDEYETAQYYNKLKGVKPK